MPEAKFRLELYCYSRFLDYIVNSREIHWNRELGEIAPRSEVTVALFFMDGIKHDRVLSFPGLSSRADKGETFAWVVRLAWQRLKMKETSSGSCLLVVSVNYVLGRTEMSWGCGYPGPIGTVSSFSVCLSLESVSTLLEKLAQTAYPLRQECFPCSLVAH
jgi:hypothetical protein